MEYEQQQKPPVAQEPQRAKNGCSLKRRSFVKLCDLIPLILLLSCLSQALQRIGLWLESSMGGVGTSSGMTVVMKEEGDRRS